MTNKTGVFQDLTQPVVSQANVGVTGAKIDFAAFKLQTCCGTGLAPRNSIQLAKTGGRVVEASMVEHGAV